MENEHLLSILRRIAAYGPVNSHVAAQTNRIESVTFPAGTVLIADTATTLTLTVDIKNDSTGGLQFYLQAEIDGIADSPRTATMVLAAGERRAIPFSFSSTPRTAARQTTFAIGVLLLDPGRRPRARPRLGSDTAAADDAWRNRNRAPAAWISAVSGGGTSFATFASSCGGEEFTELSGANDRVGELMFRLSSERWRRGSGRWRIHARRLRWPTLHSNHWRPGDAEVKRPVHHTSKSRAVSAFSRASSAVLASAVKWPILRPTRGSAFP